MIASSSSKPRIFHSWLTKRTQFISMNLKPKQKKVIFNYYIISFLILHWTKITHHYHMNARKREMNLLIEFAKTWNVKFHPPEQKRVPILTERRLLLKQISGWNSILRFLMMTSLSMKITSCGVRDTPINGRNAVMISRNHHYFPRITFFSLAQTNSSIFQVLNTKKEWKLCLQWIVSSKWKQFKATIQWNPIWWSIWKSLPRMAKWWDKKIFRNFSNKCKLLKDHVLKFPSFASSSFFIRGNIMA